MGIRWKIFLYLTAFVLVLLVLLWLFQTVFLDSFYRAIKTRSLRQAAQTVVQNIDHDDLQTLLDQLAQQGDLCIRVVNAAYEDLYSADSLPFCVIHRGNAVMLRDYGRKAAEAGGLSVDTLAKGGLPAAEGYDRAHFAGNPPPPADGLAQSMVLSQWVTRADGSRALVLLNATITPVNATVETLRVQLITITALLLALSVGLALLIARHIARPIMDTNEKAKELAQGHYDVAFTSRGYREIAELNRTLDYAAHELGQVERLRQELLANISHDLRTPLTMICGYGEVMRDLPGENTPENVQIIIDEATRLTTLVNDLLDLSKLQSGAQTLSRTDFCLTQDIRSMLSRVQKLTQQEGYRLSFSCDGEAYVHADETRLSQVLYNLISNALTYTGADKTVTVRQTIRDGYVQVAVRDTGAGVAQEDLPYIWDRYYKVDKSHRRAAVGTGLGLSIVKAILEQHHADYGVDSAPGQGSCFWFRLPLIPAP